MNNQFGNWLKEHRERAGMSQHDLSVKIGVSQSAIGQWENEKTYPRPKRMRQLCQEFGEEFGAAASEWLTHSMGADQRTASDSQGDVAPGTAALFMQTVFATRRARLLMLIAQAADGSAPQFATKYGYSKAQIYQFLSESYNCGRSMGEAAARGLEQRAELPGGWLDQPVEGRAPPGTDASASPISTGRDSEQVQLRLPDGMRDAVKNMARASHRTTNAQMVYLIQRGIEAEQGSPGSDLTALLRQSAGLMSRIAEELDTRPGGR